MDIQKLANALPINITNKINEIIEKHGALLTGLRDDVTPFPGMISPAHTYTNTDEYNWVLSTITTAAGHQIKAINIVQPAVFGTAVCSFILDSTEYAVGSELVVYFGSDSTCLPLRIVGLDNQTYRAYFVKPGEYVRLTAIAGNKWAVEAIKPGAGDGIALDVNGNVVVKAGVGLDFDLDKNLKIANSSLTPIADLEASIADGKFLFHGGGYEKIGNKVFLNIALQCNLESGLPSGTLISMTGLLPRPFFASPILANSLDSGGIETHASILIHDTAEGSGSALQLSLKKDLGYGHSVYFTGTYISES